VIVSMAVSLVAIAVALTLIGLAAFRRAESQ
jgi:hypothetical protein